MNQAAHDMLRRAELALSSAEALLDVSHDDCVSRAYYAAFYAVSALFLEEGRDFVKHTAVQAAVHRDLVHTGRWSVELGADYRMLLRLRDAADYSGAPFASGDEAAEAIDAARRVLETVTSELRS